MAFWIITVQENGVQIGVWLVVSVDKMEKCKLGPNIIRGISKYFNYSLQNGKWWLVSVFNKFSSSLLYTQPFPTMHFPLWLMVLMNRKTHIHIGRFLKIKNDSDYVNYINWYAKGLLWSWKWTVYNRTTHPVDWCNFLRVFFLFLLLNAYGH